MNLADYEQCSAELLALAKEIEDRKRPSYTNDHDDCLRNFKRDAAEAGISPLQNWLTHFQKQVSAIFRWAKDPSATQSESMESRFGDAVNYLKLGYALFREEREHEIDVLMVGVPKATAEFLAMFERQRSDDARFCAGETGEPIPLKPGHDYEMEVLRTDEEDGPIHHRGLRRAISRLRRAASAVAKELDEEKPPDAVKPFAMSLTGKEQPVNCCPQQDPNQVHDQRLVPPERSER